MSRRTISTLVGVAAAVLLWYLWHRGYFTEMKSPPIDFQGDPHAGRTYCRDLAEHAQRLYDSWNIAGCLLIPLGMFLSVIAGLVGPGLEAKGFFHKHRGLFFSLAATILSAFGYMAIKTAEKSSDLADAATSAMERVASDSAQLVDCTHAKATWLADRKKVDLLKTLPSPGEGAKSSSKFPEPPGKPPAGE